MNNVNSIQYPFRDYFSNTLLPFYDAILTPGSMLREASKEEYHTSTASKFFHYSIATAGEGWRLGLYVALGFINPIFPIGLILVGIGSRFMKKRAMKKNKTNTKKDLESMVC